MTNHPNRGRRVGGSRPDPGEVRAAREVAGDTQTEAAETIYATVRTWQNWESGIRQMPAAALELYRLKKGQITLDEAIRATARTATRPGRVKSASSRSAA